MQRPWPFVARKRELDVVETLLAGGGRPGVVIAGMAGVGKSRLAAECLARAERQGRLTAQVKASQAASALPFGALAPLLPGSTAPSAEPADMLWRARDALVALGDGKPLVLLVDDAHLLDNASATLVHQMATTRSAFVILTVRSESPAPDPVVALWKDELVERLDLPPLGPVTIETLLTTVLDGPVSASALHQLRERSAGNALYLRELVLACLDSGSLHRSDGVWELSGAPVVSSRLVELIEARLAGVQDPERKVLETLAFGEPVGVPCLLLLTSAAKLEELEERGIIVTSRDGRRLNACLAHPLYAEVIRARLPALRRQAILQGLADRVQAMGARRREDVLRFATWRLDAGGTMPAELMLAAAVTARSRWDIDLTRRLGEAAQRAGGGFEAGLLLAEVAVIEGRGQEAEDQLAALLPLAVDDRQRVRVVSARVDNLISRLGRTDEALRVTAEAEALVSDPTALDQLAAKRAFAFHVGGRLREALDVLEPLLARADGPAFAFAWYTGGACLARCGRFAEALALAEKLGVPAIAGAGDQPSFRPSLDAVVRCTVLTGAGRLHEAEAVACAEYEAGVAGGSVTVQALFALHLARTEVVMGKVASAARHAIEASNLFRDRQWRNLARTALTELALAHALGGSVDQARAALAEIDALDLPPDDLNAVELGRARAWTEAAAGDLNAARALLRDAAALARERGDLVWESEALHDLARLGRPTEVVDRLRELATLVEGDLTPARAEHTAALIAHDVAALRRVSEIFEAKGAWLLAAEAAASAAVRLRRAGDPRNAVAVELAAARLARQCQGAITPALRTIETQAMLSKREIEVAALAAAGMSNKDIASSLGVSVRTAENHLQRVYEKLGVARRADLAQALGSV
jgi:DNA-binding CsgD family transcriptional regulator